MIRNAARFVVDARWVILFALLLFGANLSAESMRGDSMIYAAVTKNLLDAENPLLLELNGAPYLNKPPLYFWWSAMFMGLFGVGAVGAKLGALIASVALCVLLYRFARRIFEDRDLGILSVVVFGLTFVVYKNTYAARMESMVTFFILASAASFWKFRSEKKLVWALLAGFLAGLGFLTKGPVAILPLAGAGVYALWQERDLLWGRSVVALILGCAVFVLTFGGWYVYAAQRSDFASVFFGEQILERMVTDRAEDAVGRPWHVYLFTLLKYDLIWVIMAVIGALNAARHERLRKPMAFLLCLMAIHLLMVHFIEAKSSRYLYQLYPFLAILAAHGLLSLRRLPVERFVAIVFVGYALVLQFLPPSSSWNVYGPLKSVTPRADAWGIPVVADPAAFTHLDERAAIDYYFDGALPAAPPEGAYLVVRPVAAPIEGATEILRTRRMWVGHVPGSTDEETKR